MLARAAAPEVVSCTNKNLGLVVRRTIKDEISIFVCFGIFAESVEEGIGKTGPLQGLQELFWDDHVGINVLDVQWGRDALKGGELLDSRW